MNVLYNIGIAFYGLGTKIVALHNDKARKLRKGQANAIAYLQSVIDRSASYIWIHASSLGEFEQGRPLIEKIHSELSDKKILLTFFSPSGYEVCKDYAGVDVVCYLPLDMPSQARAFFDTVNVEMAIFIKYEFWGNYLQELRRRAIPTYLVSAIFNDGQSFFRWWGGTFKHMLDCYTHIYVQDEPSRELLAGIGIDNVTVAGDTRFDRVADIHSSCEDKPQVEAFAQGAGMVIVAGSTWTADEDIVISYFNDSEGIKLIIAPHVVNANRLAEIESRLTKKYCHLSNATLEEAREADCLIVDCYGVLSNIYRYGDIAYVGGGFGAGIHNINEAAVYGLPVLFGPRYDKFKEAKDLLARGGAFCVTNREAFNAIIGSFVQDHESLKKSGDIARGYINENLGASAKIFQDIFSHRR